jgi:hypothetical protein
MFVYKTCIKRVYLLRGALCANVPIFHNLSIWTTSKDFHHFMQNYKILIDSPQMQEPDREYENVSDYEPTNQLGYLWRKQRQSTNVIDLRTDITGTRYVVVTGYLTWNTFFHLASFTAPNIAQALANRGFNVLEVVTADRDRKNSQYYFRITIRVYNRYSKNAVQNSVYSALLAVAYGSTIRVSGVNDNPNYSG